MPAAECLLRSPCTGQGTSGEHISSFSMEYTHLFFRAAPEGRRWKCCERFCWRRLQARCHRWRWRRPRGVAWNRGGGGGGGGGADTVNRLIRGFRYFCRETHPVHSNAKLRTDTAADRQRAPWQPLQIARSTTYRFAPSKHILHLCSTHKYL